MDAKTNTTPMTDVAKIGVLNTLRDCVRVIYVRDVHFDRHTRSAKEGIDSAFASPNPVTDNVMSPLGLRQCESLATGLLPQVTPTPLGGQVADYRLDGVAVYTDGNIKPVKTAEAVIRAASSNGKSSPFTYTGVLDTIDPKVLFSRHAIKSGGGGDNNNNNTDDTEEVPAAATIVPIVVFCSARSIRHVITKLTGADPASALCPQLGSVTVVDLQEDSNPVFHLMMDTHICHHALFWNNSLNV
jgi:broad specificity phosphatase PhoE